MENTLRIAATPGVIDSDMAVARATQLLLSRLGGDPESLRTVVESGRQEFFRVARAELGAGGLSNADLDRVFQLIRRHLAARS